jgi:hypothetical protein
MSSFSKTYLNSQADTVLADNTGGDISPADVRDMVKNMIDSYQDIAVQMDTAARDAIVTPATGLWIFNTDVALYEYYNGSAWVSLQTATTETAQIFTKKVSITSAQILDSYTTPIELIPAQGAGTTIEVISCTSLFTFNTIAYATNTSAKIFYDSDTASGVFGTFDLTYSATAYQFFVNGGPSISDIDNNAIIFMTETGNPTAGDGTIDIYLTYRVITL